MLALAIKDEEHYEIDSRELASSASPYTVDTLTALRAERPDDELYLLLGADQHASMRGWHRPAEVRRLARIAVVTRPGYSVESGGAIVVPMSPLAITTRSNIDGMRAVL